MLNLSFPHGTVHGHEHAKYFQNKKYYNAQKDEIDVETGKVIKAHVPIPPPGDPMVAPKSVAPKSAAPKSAATGGKPMASTSTPMTFSDSVPTTLDENAPIDLDTAHWQVLKKMVIDAGGEYVNKKQAVAYLRSM